MFGFGLKVLGHGGGLRGPLSGRSVWMARLPGR